MYIYVLGTLAQGNIPARPYTYAVAKPGLGISAFGQLLFCIFAWFLCVFCIFYTFCWCLSAGGGLSEGSLGGRVDSAEIAWSK